MPNQGFWQNPVIVELHGVGQYRTIGSNVDAAECLMNKWPADEDEVYRDALIICLAAVEGRSSCDIAHEAFIEAAHHACIYIRPSPRTNSVNSSCVKSRR